MEGGLYLGIRWGTIDNTRSRMGLYVGCWARAPGDNGMTLEAGEATRASSTLGFNIAGDKIFNIEGGLWS